MSVLEISTFGIPTSTRGVMNIWLNERDESKHAHGVPRSTKLALASYMFFEFPELLPWSHRHRTSTDQGPTIYLYEQLICTGTDVHVWNGAMSRPVMSVPSKKLT